MGHKVNVNKDNIFLPLILRKYLLFSFTAFFPPFFARTPTAMPTSGGEEEHFVPRAVNQYCPRSPKNFSLTPKSFLDVEKSRSMYYNFSAKMGKDT